jgi:cytochrome c oxidase subunit 2
MGPLVLHTPASAHGAEVDNLMNITWILIFIVQAITQVLLYYFAFKYRGRKDRKALYFADNKLEALECYSCHHIGWLILYGLYAWTNIMFIDEEDDAIVVELYGAVLLGS